MNLTKIARSLSVALLVAGVAVSAQAQDAKKPVVKPAPSKMTAAPKMAAGSKMKGASKMKAASKMKPASKMKAAPAAKKP